ncbi:ABC transporter ATP-binding protein [Rhodospirillaceae bacterium KN72]|uniref:ABC transporter ATP-binding protein n=2 Tax=Pacificispira spongiicola TaxID=2729598 RepID=A0A7Y0DX60_9PROT|nr:ABC transporter ATP-binding protein [Pacificispira spongiicola]
MPGVSIHGAALAYAGRTVFDDLDLSLPGGEWTALLGPSGVGKSSLLRLIAGLPAAGGTAAGSVRATDGASLAGRIAYMAQRDLLLPWLSVLDNVRLGARMRGKGRDADSRRVAMHLLDTMGLADRATDRPGSLSGGMRQRVALARTLFEDAPIVLMDEPFSALDAVTRFQLQEMAASLLSGRTVLLVTHDPMEALRLAGRIMILSGSPARLRSAGDPPALSIPRDPFQPEMAERAALLFQQLGSGSLEGAAS